MGNIYPNPSPFNDEKAKTNKMMKIFDEQKISIATFYPSCMAAEAAVKESKQSGLDLKKISIVGQHDYTDGESAG